MSNFGTQSSTYLNVSPLNLIFTSGQSTTSNNVGNYAVVNGTQYAKSLFNNSQMAFFPTGVSPTTGNVSNTTNSSSLHTGSGDGTGVYDISPVDIVSYTSKYPSMQIKSSDLAYLKNIGVFPNNRLIVARRFAAGVSDDLTALPKGTTPMATLISWVPDEKDFIDFDFGEEWTESDADLSQILNDAGKDEIRLSGLGDTVSSLGSALPLPGMFEGLQYKIFQKLGISNLDPNNLPLGNPNLVRQAMMRKTLGKKDAGSGLKCKFEIEMEVEYEQKFIQGLDPTFIYLDILQNILSFGSSDSQFQFSNGLGTGASQFLNNITSNNIRLIDKAVQDFVNAMVTSFIDLGDALLDSISGKSQNGSTQNSGGITGITDSFMNSLNFANVISTTISSTIGKYKVRIMGVLNALTGLPSAPWHVTIGNPKRPFFMSGDMVIDNVKVSFGPTLAFNDLPSTIKATFTLKSARNVGAQEIFRKFNSGRGRSYQKIDLSYVESSTINTGSGDPTNTTQQQINSVIGTASYIQNTNTSSSSVQQQNQNAQNQQNSYSRQGQTGDPTQIANQNNGINQPSAQNTPNNAPGVQAISDPSNANNNTLQTRLNYLNNQPNLTPQQQNEKNSIQNQLNTRNAGGFNSQNQQIINQSN